MELEKLTQIIARVMNLEFEEIREEMNLTDDLGADSLDIYQMIIGVEEELQIEINADDAERIRTVRELLELINGMPDQNREVKI